MKNENENDSEGLHLIRELSYERSKCEVKLVKKGTVGSKALAICTMKVEEAAT
jgi:hypothetical protein